MKNKLPLILQSEISECGLACLAMVLAYYQCHAPLAELRQKIQSTSRGVTLYQLKKLAEYYSLAATVYRVELDQLNSMTLPCVLHWEINHFVVLKKISKHTIVIHDPYLGCRTLKKSELNKKFTGIVLSILPTENFQFRNKNKLVSHQIIRDLIKSNKTAIIKLFILSCVIQASYLLSILFIRKGIDLSVNQHNLSAVSMIICMVGTQIILLSIEGLRTFTVISVGTEINYHFCIKIMTHLMNLPLSFFNNRQTSSILSRFSILEKIRNTFTEGMAESMVDGLVSIILIICLFLINIKSALIICVCTTIFLMTRYHSHNKLLLHHEEAMQTRSLESTSFLETIDSMPVIKIFTKENKRIEHWEKKYVSTLNSVTQLAWCKLKFDSLKYVIFTIELGACLAVLYSTITNQFITITTLYIFLSYRQQLNAVIIRLAEKWYDFRALFASLNKLEDILAEPREIPFLTKNESCHTTILSLHEISYRYSPESVYLFNNITTEIQKGQLIAITGPSGSGKSSLLKLMSGLIQPETGYIQINCTKQEIAAVFQEESLLSGTILENISFFDYHADLLWAKQCAKLACIDQEIESMTMGYYTLVGDRGKALSGGQRQRIMLARALYSKPKIVFLDEATSHLDSVNEDKIYKNLKNLNLTLVMISHHSEIITYADAVIKLGAC